jgi:A/G-specific adenine glycosylase
MYTKSRIAISEWYQTYKRTLPWRQTKSAYHIWISEVILQQTRVLQGLPYYNKFIKAFPSIHDLAQAPESEVLILWQGLGYYSRARNMHFTAKYICDNYQGIFPSNYNEIKKLKGVGDYTAAAIASFAFELPFAAVDGNVMRVISRVYGIEEDVLLAKTKKHITAIAQEMMGDSSPSLFNQSMMEFGALQCKAKAPQCNSCPLIDQCYAYHNNKVTSLPTKLSRTKVRSRHFNYLLIKSNSGIYIQQRIGKGIWQNLYEFPLLESQAPLSEVELLKELRQYCNANIKLEYRSKEIKHKLSHQLLHIHFNTIACDSIKVGENWKLIPIYTIDDYPFPEIINKHKNRFL